MFYRINNKNIEEILQDFHFIVMYHPPMKLKNNTYFYPWEVWVNDEIIAQDIKDFKMRISGYNMLNDTEIFWNFCNTIEAINESKQKFGPLLTITDFIKKYHKKYLYGLSYGIVDTYDSQKLEQSNVMCILKKNNYDFSEYRGCLKKKI